MWLMMISHAVPSHGSKVRKEESQAKAVPSATAEEIQGLTNNPENFLCRDHRKCIDSVYLSVVWKQLQPRLQGPAESCALS